MKDYRGVKWMPSLQKWQSTVRHGGRSFNCGLHSEQKLAVIARDTCILNNGLKVELQILKPLKKNDTSNRT